MNSYNSHMQKLNSLKTNYNRLGVEKQNCCNSRTHSNSNVNILDTNIVEERNQNLIFFPTTINLIVNLLYDRYKTEKSWYTDKYHNFSIYIQAISSQIDNTQFVTTLCKNSVLRLF